MITVILAKTLKWAVLLFFLVATLMPLIWLVFSSLKTNFEFETQPFALPQTLQFQNYVNAIQISGLPRLFFNSIIASGFATLLNVIVTSMAAFVFSRIRFRFSEAILNMMIAGVLVPIIALMVPYFRLISALNLYDTLLGLIITYAAINLPISLFLVYSFMKGIPYDLEEAAIIDGCNVPQRYLFVILPLSRLGLVTAATFVFLYCWNEFIYALLLTSSVSSRTIQLGIRFFRSQFFTDFTSMFAAITITMIPGIILYVFLHERIIGGLTTGAIRG